MTFREMMQVFIDAFQEQAKIPGGKLVSNHKVKLLEQVTETIGDKVLSVDTLLTAIKEVEVLSDYNRECVYVSDLLDELERAGIKCKS